MNKEVFVKFIERGYLNKSIESLVFEVEDNKISTFFKSELLANGLVELDDFDYDDCEIGIYYPDVLLKMLAILDNEIDLDIKKDKQGVVNSLKFKDKKGKSITYATSPLEIFDRPEKKKAKISDYEVKINLNSELIDDILKAIVCSGSDKVNFIYDKDKLDIVFGYSANNSNIIKFELECEEVEDIGNIAFNAKILKEVLSVNVKKFKEGTLQINAKGLMRVGFEEDKNKAEYFFLKLTDQEENE